jgi:hypothetical protein
VCIHPNNLQSHDQVIGAGNSYQGGLCTVKRLGEGRQRTARCKGLVQAGPIAKTSVDQHQAHQGLARTTFELMRVSPIAIGGLLH